VPTGIPVPLGQGLDQSVGRILVALALERHFVCAVLDDDSGAWPRAGGGQPVLGGRPQLPGGHPRPEARDPDRRRDAVDRPDVQHLELEQDALEATGCLVVLGLGEHDPELVVSEARDEIGAARLVADHGGDCLQDPVGRLAAVTRGDVVEAVDSQDSHAQRAPVALRALDRFVELAAEDPGVGEPRELVADRATLELALELGDARVCSAQPTCQVSQFALPCTHSGELGLLDHEPEAQDALLGHMP